MANGGRSSGDRWSGVDLLEGRFLLSHVTGSHGAHESTVPAQIAPMPVIPRPTSEASRSGTSTSAIEARDAEQMAAEVLAASSEARSGYSIPLVTPGRGIEGFDKARSTQGTSDSSLFLRKSSRDDPVAWAVTGDAAAGFVWSAHRQPDPASEVPEFAIRDAQETLLVLLSARPSGSESLRGLSPSRGSDLLADFLPADRPSLERAIDRLFDGFEGLGSDIVRGVEATGMVPSPVVWAVTLAVLEVARRRLRRLQSEEEDGLDPDRDPAVGLLGFPA